MTRKTINEASFSEIFRFAAAKFGLGWNLCNDLFFNPGPLDYKSFNDFTIGDLEFALSERVKGDPHIQAYEVLIAFMKEHKVKSMRVDNT